MSLLRVAARQASCVIVNSLDVAAGVPEVLHLPASAVKVIPNPLDSKAVVRLSMEGTRLPPFIARRKNLIVTCSGSFWSLN